MRFTRFLPTTVLLVTVLLGARPLAAGPLRIQDDILPPGVVGAPYNYSLQGIGGQGAPYTFTATGLPPGLTLSSAGLISGTPTGAARFTFTTVVTDSSGINPRSQSLTLEMVRAESGDNWCSRGGFGGSVGALAASYWFEVDAGEATSSNTAVAGSSAGLLMTDDGGTNWRRIPGTGLRAVTGLAAAPDECQDGLVPMRFLFGGQAGNGQFVFGRGDTSAVTVEPLSWGALPPGASANIRIQYNPACAASNLGAVAISDGHIYWRDPAASVWNWISEELERPQCGGCDPIVPFDLAFGHAGDPTLIVVLGLNTDSFVLPTYHPGDQGWGAIPVAVAYSGAHGTPAALTMTPDGRIVIASSRGGLQRIDPGNASTVTPPGRFFDGSLSVEVNVRKLEVSSMYQNLPGQRRVFAATSAGIYRTEDIADLAAYPFVKISQGLLTESIATMAIPKVLFTGDDTRLLAAAGDKGIAYGRYAQLCHARLKKNDQPQDWVALAPTKNFVNNGAAACITSNNDIGLMGASASLGVLRSSRDGREYFPADETREKVITGLTNPGLSDDIWAASASGVYYSPAHGLQFTAFSPTDEPLRVLSAVTPNRGYNLKAYGISTGWLYASDTAPAWSRIADLTAVAGCSSGCAAADIAPGGGLAAGANHDQQWITAGLGGLIEYQLNAGSRAYLRHTGLAGLDARKVTAGQRVGINNYVYVQVRDPVDDKFKLYRGVKTASASAQISFTRVGLAAGNLLPDMEEAAQIVVEPNLDPASGSGHVWVLLKGLGLYLSTDAGLGFHRVAGTGLPVDGYRPLRLVLARDFSAASRDLALLAEGDGVYYSHDGGETYCYGKADLRETATRINDAAASVLNAERLAAGTEDGIFLSADRGAHWNGRTHTQAFNKLPVQALVFCPIAAGTEVLIAAGPGGIFRSTESPLFTTWNQVSALSGVTDLVVQDGTQIVTASRGAGSPLRSLNCGSSWSVQSGPGDGQALSYNAGTSLIEGATAGYWMASSSGGANWSTTGTSWTAANGSGDYSLSGLGGNWLSISSLGGSPSKVLIGNATQGLYRTLDGGDSWRKVSGPGSGLESSSQNATALITATTPQATTDLLVGMAGSTTGGVYLSGDNGEHWTQVNQGFDPNNLNINTLVKTSCSGCPVQYYTGTYGSGVYTRTIPVVPAPNFPSASAACFGSTGCACNSAAGSGPEQGGQAFRICGANFLALATVEFDGVPATGCSVSGSTVITCTGTPPHIPGAAVIRVRNTDTRTGYLPNGYSYTAGTPRATGLTLAKSGSNAVLNYTCPGCTAPPPRVYRSQNAPFNLNVEQYTGGAGSYTNAGALATGSNPTYFWNVE